MDGATNDLLDVFSTNAPNQDAAQNTNSALDDIFAQGSQPLAPKANEIPTNDKMAFLNQFYAEGSNQAAAQQPNPQSQFNTQ